MKKHLFLLCFVSGLCLSFSAMAQSGKDSISKAQENYEVGRLQECITILNNALKDRKLLNYSQKKDAFRLIAMSYLAVDSVSKADSAIQELIILNNNLETDSQDPVRYQLRVWYIRNQLRSDIISSVSKKAENVELAPATIQIISAEDILNRGYQDLESVFSDLPGFDVSRTNGLSYSTLYQRGYRSSALTDRTLVLVDGVEDNELWTNAAYISKQYPISSVKRIEIIYGPASTIYGANAFQGVINIVTKGEADLFPSRRGEDLYQQNDPQQSKSTHYALNLHAGAGAYKTNYYDATLAMKNEKLFFSVTGRLYQSDEYDLSKYKNWDGKLSFDNATYARMLKQGNNAAPDSMIMKARFLDSVNYYKATATNGANQYRNRTHDFYLSSKLNVGDLKLIFQYWNINEGTASDYLDNYTAINLLNNWQIKQYFMSARYDKQVSNKLNVSWFSYFKASQFGPGASNTRYRCYGNGDLSLTDLANNVSPYFRSTYYSTQTNQFRSEITGNYTINQFFDITAGAEFRNGMQQGDYVQGNQFPAVLLGNTADSLPGGNNYSSFTYGVYTQVNYQNKKNKLNINAGGRFDNNKFRQSQGYGSVFNSRGAIVYYPGNFIFKAIYSEAFLDASSFNKFSTSATRQLNNPGLKPERVRNIELTARYNRKKTSVEVAAYSAHYNSILQTASVPLPGGGATSQFQALYEVRIKGIQVTAQTMLNKNISFYANFSTTDPKIILNKDTAIRLGDISKYTLNAGVNLLLLKDKVNVNVRTNIVGNKPTGKGTSVSRNPLTQINSYGIISGAVSVKISKALRLQFICDNALNQFYESPGIRTADNFQFASSVPQPLRNCYLKLIVNISK